MQRHRPKKSSPVPEPACAFLIEDLLDEIEFGFSCDPTVASIARPHALLLAKELGVAFRSYTASDFEAVAGKPPRN